MSDWWKNPVLQGEDNDYGQYDYLVNSLPENTMEWIKGECHCDSCGKYRKLNYRATNFFYSLDGYGSLDYTQCWKCQLGDWYRYYKKKITKPFINKKTTFELAMIYNSRIKKKTGKGDWESALEKAKEMMQYAGVNDVIRIIKDIKEVR